MNSKFTRLALPGVVLGLALGLSFPAASFAQDHHHGRGDRGSRGGDSGDQSASRDNGDRGGGRGGDRGGSSDQRTGFVGARTQTGAAVDSRANATGPGHPGWGDHSDRGGDRGNRGSDRGTVSTDARSGGNWGGNRGGGSVSTANNAASGWVGGSNDRHDDHRDDHRGDDHRGDDHRGDRGSNWGGDHRSNGGGSNWGGSNGGSDNRRADRDRDDRHHDDRGGRGRFDWHNDSRFHDYSGIRLGFYFAPGHGYYRVPDQWYGHRWNRGEYLPRYFFSYRIYDPDYYGLPYPPYGCGWFFVGEDAVLIDLDTGEIVDVIYDVF